MHEAQVVVPLVLSLTGALVFLTLAVNELINWYFKVACSSEEWKEQVAYRQYLKTTCFGRDIAAWRADGRPGRYLLGRELIDRPH
jgi:hypothetical protein